MNIPFLSLKDVTALHGAEINEAITRVVNGGWYLQGKENEKFEGVLHVLQEWSTDVQKLEFLQKFGWLMSDEAVRTYSAKFKPKR